MNEESNINNNQHLDAKQEAIVAVSALTARGDIKGLKVALNAGLDAGLTVNELKEILIQLYAYCGFPRSLNGINALIAVLEERKAKGINDVPGKDAAPVTDTTSKYDTGKKTLEILTRRAETGAKTGAAAFAPVIDTFLKEHLFADIFSRDVLTYLQREHVTIAALASMDGVEPQLQAHLSMGLNVGITEPQLKQFFTVIENNIGKKEADTAREILNKVMASMLK